MRDAFGGVFTMNFMLVFIFIFVAFAAVSLNYAKAFRLKNSIIDFVEQNEIIDLTDIDSKTSQLDTILNKSNYYKPERCPDGNNGTIKNAEGKTYSYCYNGVYITETGRQSIEGTDSEIIQYEIATFANWNLGALNKILALGGKSENSEETLFGAWTIKGETQIVMKK